jgi:hypothetical protein
MNGARRPIVSDHAVLRWIERRFGFDVETERRKIEQVTKAARAAGATSLAVDGVKFVIREGHVVTTLETGMLTARPDKDRIAREGA